MPEPQLFDIIALVLVAWLTIRGAMRGMITQVTSVVAIVVSWIVAAKFSPKLAPMISDEGPYNKIIAMLLLFIATSVVIWLLHGFVAGIFEKIKLKGFDRQMGALLGLAKGLLLCMILTFFLVTLTERSKNFALNSLSGKYFARGIEKIGSIIPEDANVILKKNLEGFQESLYENEDGSGFFSKSTPQSTEKDNSEAEKSLTESIKESVGKTILGKINDSLSKTSTNNAPEEALPSNVNSGAYSSVGRNELYAAPVSLNEERSTTPENPVAPFKSSSTGYPPVIPKR